MPEANAAEEPVRSRSILQRIFGRPAAKEPEGDSTLAVTIAVASGKGGTGKSFFASNLACGISARGIATTIVDCDFGLGDAHLLLGVNPKLSLQHLIGGQAGLDEVVVRTPFGPMLVPGGSGLSHLADLTDQQLFVLTKALGRLAARDEALVLDTAAGISPQNLLPSLAAEHVIIVTNPEIAALTDAYALVKCLAREGRTERIHIVLNRVREPGQGEASFTRLADVAKRFSQCSLHYLGEIPEEAAAAHRRLGQAPLITSQPTCPATLAILGILDRLATQTGGFRQRTLRTKHTLEHKMAAKIGQCP